MKINTEITKDRIVKTPSGKEFYLMELNPDPEKRIFEVADYLALNSERILESELKEHTPEIMKMIIKAAPKEVRQSAFLVGLIHSTLEKALSSINDKDIIEFIGNFPVYHNPLKYADVLTVYSKNYITTAELLTRAANEIKNNTADYTVEETPNGNIKIQ